MELTQKNHNQTSIAKLSKFKKQNQTILEEVPIANQDITNQDIFDYAKLIGIEPNSESELLWIAKAGLIHDLPLFWTPVEDSQGRIYYFNFQTLESSWDHPLDRYYRLLVRSERIKILSKKVMSKLLANLHFFDDNGSLKESPDLSLEEHSSLSEKNVISDENESNEFEFEENNVTLVDNDDDDEVITIDVTEEGACDVKKFKEIYTLPLNENFNNLTGQSFAPHTHQDFPTQIKDETIDEHQLNELSQDPFEDESAKLLKESIYKTSQSDESEIALGNHQVKLLPEIETKMIKIKSKEEKSKEEKKVTKDDLDKKFENVLSQINLKIEKIEKEINDKMEQIMSQDMIKENNTHFCPEKDRLNSLESNFKSLQTSFVEIENKWSQDLNEIKGELKNFDKITKSLVTNQDSSTLVKLNQDLKTLNDELKKIKLKDLKKEKKNEEDKNDQQNLNQKLKKINENISNLSSVIDKETNKVKQLIEEKIKSITKMYSKDIDKIKTEQDAIKTQLNTLMVNVDSRNDPVSTNDKMISKISLIEKLIRNISNKLDINEEHKTSSREKLFRPRKVLHVSKFKQESESSSEEITNHTLKENHLHSNHVQIYSPINYSKSVQSSFDQISMEIRNQKRYQDIRASSIALLSLIKKTSNMLKTEVDQIDSIGNYQFTTNFNNQLFNNDQSDTDQVTIDQLEMIRNNIDTKLKKLNNLINGQKI